MPARKAVRAEDLVEVLAQQLHGEEAAPADLIGARVPADIERKRERDPAPRPEFTDEIEALFGGEKAGDRQAGKGDASRPLGEDGERRGEIAKGAARLAPVAMPKEEPRDRSRYARGKYHIDPRFGPGHPEF